MAKYIIEDTTLKNIADAIRDKNGESQQYTPEEMVTKIEEIETGGGSGGSGYSIEYINGGVVGKEEKFMQDIENGVWINGNYLFNENTAFDYSQLSGKNLKLTDCTNLFHKASTTAFDIDFSNFNTEKVFSFKYAFSYVQYKDSVDLTGINTKNATDMSYMFYRCNSLTEIKGLNKLDTSKCEDMRNMFSYILHSKCNLDLSNFALGNDEREVQSNNMFDNGIYNSIIFPSSGNMTCSSLFNKAKVNEQINMSGIKCYANASAMLSGATLYGGIILPDFPNISATLTLGDSSSKIYRLKFGEGNSFGRDTTAGLTLNLAYLWRGAKETAIPSDYGGGTYEEAFLEFANSISVNETGKARTIKIYTTLYNSLSDEQKAILTDKNYTLSSGTS